MTDSIEELHAENTRLQAELGNIADENSKLKIELAQASTEIERLSKATTHSDDDLAQAANKLKRLNDENSELKEYIDHASVELKRLTDETSTLKAALAQATDDIRQLEADCASEVTRLRTDAVVKRHEVTTLTSQLIQATDDIARLRSEQEDAPSARRDLIRRLVAIAISAGFAGQLVTMKAAQQWAGWTKLPGLDDPFWQTMARLLTSMLVILLAWDWYDRDVKDKPLTRIGRFILDAMIVSMELILLLCSSYPRLWSIVLLAIFGLYVVWDIFSIVDHPSAFGFDHRYNKLRYAPRNILYTYTDGAIGDQRKRGPPINLAWFIYFFLVLWLFPFRGMYAGFVTCLMVILGAALLWCEGVVRSDGRRIIAWWGRVILFLLLAIFYRFLWEWL